MMASYGVWSSNPNSWHDRESVVTIAHVIDSVVKCAGAPLCRWIIGRYGQFSYAAMQLTLASLSLFNFVWARYFQMHITEQELQAAMPTEVFHDFKTWRQQQLRKMAPRSPERQTKKEKTNQDSDLASTYPIQTPFEGDEVAAAHTIESSPSGVNR